MNVKRLICLMAIVLAFAATSAFATTWTTYLTATGTTGQIQVDTTATQVGSLWHWAYDVTPLGGATEVRGFTITLGANMMGMVSNNPGPTKFDGTNWVAVPDWASAKGATRVYWSFDVINGIDSNKLNAGDSYRFEYDHPYGPVAEYAASAQDTYGWGGVVMGPAVPEPMSMMTLLVGLSGIAGLKLRRK